MAGTHLSSPPRSQRYATELLPIDGIGDDPPDSNARAPLLPAPAAAQRGEEGAAPAPSYEPPPISEPLPISRPFPRAAPLPGAAAARAAAGGPPVAPTLPPSGPRIAPTLPPGGTLRPTRRSSIVRLAASGRASTLEIALLASRFEQIKHGPAGRAFKYSQVVWIAAIPTGLALLGLALSRAPLARLIAGIAAAASLGVMLAAAIAYGLARWGDRVARGTEVSVSPEVAAAYAAIVGKPSVASVSSPARVVLGVLTLAVGVTSVVATWSFAKTVHLAHYNPWAPPLPVELAEEPVPELPPEQRADYRLRRGGHVYVSGGLLYVPPSFRSDDGMFDLVMHFHGNTQLIEESFEAAKVNALVYIVNLGLGSGVYEDRYAHPRVFDDTLARVREGAEKRGLRNARVRRIALSAWSAGYGAITKIIDSQKNADRIDALLMLDGMHVSYLDPKRKTDLDPNRLAPLLRAAKEAAEGRKLFTITHSDIKPPDYASVAETTDALLRALDVERVARRDEPPRIALTAAIGVVAKDAERPLRQTSEARRGGLHVRGYAGETAEDHMAHLIQMSSTVLPELAERWKQ